MGLADALRALGLGRALGPVQPDVSGSTIPHLLREMGPNPELLAPALGAFYEEVHRSRPSPDLLHFDLWRDGQPMAALLCDYAAAPRCTFTYRDTEPRVNAFLGQAFVWTEAQVGPITATEGPQGSQAFTASSDSLAVTLSRPAEGGEAEARLVLAFNGE